ncbi:MAG: type IV toxin-antitoxin system AbiEi family antitoxin domain-containing protein [Planctomycetota bacterium]
MRASAWRKYFEEQRERHNKVLFTVTELANVARASPATLNVELARLRQQEIVVRYAHGLYGIPGVVSPQTLVAAIDPHAYITGHYALYEYQMVTQVPGTITCFTDRRSPRARERVTPVGRLVFVCVRSSVYFPVPEATIAPAAQALCDYVYLSRRRGAEPEALVTFRNLARIRAADLAPLFDRYPISVQKHVASLTHLGVLP